MNGKPEEDLEVSPDTSSIGSINVNQIPKSIGKENSNSRSSSWSEYRLRSTEDRKRKIKRKMSEESESSEES